MKISLPSHLSANLIEFKILSWKPFSPQNFEVFPSCLLASSIVVEKSVPILITNVYNLLIFIDKFIYFKIFNLQFTSILFCISFQPSYF